MPNTIFSLLLLFSGFSALTYQIVWIRMLGISFGITAIAVSAAISAFFLGMAIGSALTRKIKSRGWATLQTFALVELTTGVAALVLIPVLMNLDAFVAMAPSLFHGTEMKFLVSMLLLLIPTICIGITYPLMAIITTQEDSHITQNLSRLYAMNTLGAVVGALVAGFVLLPQLGISLSIMTAAAVNLLVAATAYLYRHKVAVIIDQGEQVTRKVESTSNNKLLLLVIAVTGFCTLSAEIVWVKYLSVLSGGTLYTYTVVIAAMLGGIALGSYMISVLRKSDSMSIKHLVWGLIFLSVALLVNRLALWNLPLHYFHFMTNNTGSSYLSQFSVIFLLFLPPSFMLGVLFPLSIKLYCQNISSLQSNIGIAYAVNTIFAVLGSVLSVLWLIPHIGSDNLLIVLILMTLGLAIVLSIKFDKLRQRITILSSASVLAVATFVLPGIDYEELILSSARWNKLLYRDKFHFVQEGQTGVVSLLDNSDGVIYIQKDGLNEASIEDKDPRKGTLAATLLGVLPSVLHESPRSAFVVGFGGGTTSKILSATPLDDLHITELEPSIINAVRHIPGDSYNFLDNENVTLEFNDARNSLLVDTKSFDIIISQPSHPWLSGMGNMFSTEFYNIVKSRLNSGGIFAQWINFASSDLVTIKSMMRTFYNQFPEGVAFVSWNGGEIILLGSANELSFDYYRLQQMIQHADLQAALAYHRIFKPSDILEHYLFTRESALLFSADTKINTDDNLFAELRLARLRHKPAEWWPTYDALQKHSQWDRKENIKIVE